MNKSRIKLVLSYLLGITGTILLVVFVLTLILKNTLFNKTYVKKVLTNNDYYESVSDEILVNMQNYMMSSGLPESILDDIFTKNDVKKSIDAYIDSYYSNEKHELDISDIKDKLKTNIDEYLNSHNVVANEGIVSEFIDDMSDIYKKEIEHYNILNIFRSKFNKVNKITKIVMYINFILFIITLIILVKLKFEYTISIIGASGLVLLFIETLISEKINIDSINVISSNFSHIASVLYDNIIHLITISSVTLIFMEIVTILCISIKKLLKN